MKVIDLDSHSLPRRRDYCIEPEYAHLRPRTYVDTKGTLRELFDDKPLRTLSRQQLARAEQIVKHPDLRAANYDAAIRYKHVTDAGVDFQFISCGIISAFSYVDEKVGAAFYRAYNNFMYERFMKPYPKTFSGVPQLPLQDIPQALKEIQRCVTDLGMLTFIMPTNWNGIDMANLHWWNFYDHVRELGITGIIVHAGTLHDEWVGKDRLTVLGPDGTNGRHILSHPFEYCTNVVNLMFGGMMDAFPEFRFAFLEVGAECAVWLKHRIEENVEQIGYLRDMLSGPVEKYFDRFYFVVDDILVADNGRRLEYAINELGADHLFFGSDHPHADSHLDLGSLLKTNPRISSEVKEAILGKNAETFIGRELP